MRNFYAAIVRVPEILASVRENLLRTVQSLTFPSYRQKQRAEKVETSRVPLGIPQIVLRNFCEVVLPPFARPVACIFAIFSPISVNFRVSFGLVNVLFTVACKFSLFRLGFSSIF